ncbi:hypothetical protein EDEG_01463 [Edhazardia aedis USNM 41457]|uniref:Uncharacterized protein n=1 Tax=Edhazardia aedis (strain USNM 41457) TaxID=1003232 RepID=J9D922_EDHAE|nr:hypothetical protein EDEG_01463 [Edhazardia aedis USNM 41457]|eukprot:EJW04271.1 hypothetical protein EDEG_01463 [Edhazardia aedis USNM 41457]
MENDESKEKKAEEGGCEFSEKIKKDWLCSLSAAKEKKHKPVDILTDSCGMGNDFYEFSQKDSESSNSDVETKKFVNMKFLDRIPSNLPKKMQDLVDESCEAQTSTKNDFIGGFDSSNKASKSNECKKSNEYVGMNITAVDSKISENSELSRISESLGKEIVEEANICKNTNCKLNFEKNSCKETKLFEFSDFRKFLFLRRFKFTK